MTRPTIYVVSYSYLARGNAENETFLFATEEDAVKEAERIRRITSQFSANSWKENENMLCRRPSDPTCPLLFAWVYLDVASLRIYTQEVRLSYRRTSPCKWALRLVGTLVANTHEIIFVIAKGVDMTDQQTVFNRVWERITAQGKPGVDDKGRCCFRAPNGSKCAIGVLIADDEYKPELDKELVGMYALMEECPSLHEYTRHDLIDMQIIHDSAARSAKGNAEAFMQEFHAMMRDYADRWGLTCPALHKTPKKFLGV